MSISSGTRSDALYPLHAWIFGGMVKAIAERAEAGPDANLGYAKLAHLGSERSRVIP